MRLASSSFLLLAVLLGWAIFPPSVSAQDWAKARLENSPRHGEWVKVPNADRQVNCFVVYPEVPEKATAVLVIHEIFGMTDWVRGVCDQLAEAGYVAVAPDMLSGQTTHDVDAARKAVSELSPEQVTSDLKATAAYIQTLPSTNGKLAVVGFCWGGGQAFRLAGDQEGLAAALPFYGPPPQTAAEAAAIGCPLYGFFAGNDARINSMLPQAEEVLKEAGKKFEFITYEGAGHGFMRQGEDPAATPENKKARNAAWERMKKILGSL